MQMNSHIPLNHYCIMFENLKRLIDYIHSVDKNAFVISLESKEVFGEGFKQYDKESIK